MDKILGVVRTLLAAGIGYFAGKGVIDSSAVEPIVSAILTIGVAIWSILAKSDKFPKIK
jgi:hypothetical protein